MSARGIKVDIDVDHCFADADGKVRATVSFRCGLVRGSIDQRPHGSALSCFSCARSGKKRRLLLHSFIALPSFVARRPTATATVAQVLISVHLLK